MGVTTFYKPPARTASAEITVQKQGQGSAVAARSRATEDPLGPMAPDPSYFQWVEVQGLGPSREGARRTMWAWAEPSLHLPLSRRNSLHRPRRLIIFT
jgi:hypothetical protein